MVLAISLTTNFVFDNYITPRFLGRTLDIHPAAVLVAALFMASLMGVIGIFLAAPVVATIKLLGMYVFRKMFDLDNTAMTDNKTIFYNILKLPDISGIIMF